MWCEVGDTRPACGSNNPSGIAPKASRVRKIGDFGHVDLAVGDRMGPLLAEGRTFCRRVGQVRPVRRFSQACPWGRDKFFSPASSERKVCIERGLPGVHRNVIDDEVCTRGCRVLVRIVPAWRQGGAGRVRPGCWCGKLRTTCRTRRQGSYGCLHSRCLCLHIGADAFKGWTIPAESMTVDGYHSPQGRGCRSCPDESRTRSRHRRGPGSR